MDRPYAAFCKTYSVFLKTLGTVFPECQTLARARQAAIDLETAPEATQQQTLQQWDEAMKRTFQGKSYYEHVTARNGNIFYNAADLPFVKAVNMWPKWTDAGFNAESKECVWKFLDVLNRKARLCVAMPTDASDKIFGIVEKYVTVSNNQIAFNGDAKLSDLMQDMNAMCSGLNASQLLEFAKMALQEGGADTVMNPYLQQFGMDMQGLIGSINTLNPEMIAGLLKPQ